MGDGIFVRGAGRWHGRGQRDAPPGDGAEVRLAPIEGLETRAGADGKDRRVCGYAVVFGRLSEPLGGFREKVARGAFAESLRSHHAKAFWNHNTDLVLGSTKNETLKLSEDSIGLRFELALPDTSWGRDAYESIRRGDVDGVSFGFSVLADSWERRDPANVVRTLTCVRLHEVSPTPMPAYPESSVAARSKRGAYAKHLDRERRLLDERAVRAAAAARGAGMGAARARELYRLQLLEREDCT